MSIGRDVSRALKWSAFGRLASQLVTWSVTLYVIRILNPEDYGLIAIAASVISLLTLINEMGLGAAIVQSASITPEKIKNIQGAIFATSGILVVLAVIIAPYVAIFFGKDEITLIIIALSGQFFIGSFYTVPNSLLVRKLDFKLISLIELTSRTLGSLSVLALALMGHGVWSLVFGNLVTVAIKTVATIWITKYRISTSFQIRKIVREVQFGISILGQRIVWWVSSQADSFIIGRMISVEALGIYSVANHLASLPQQKVGEILNQISLSAFSKSQDDPQETLSRLRKSTSFLFIFSFPVFFGISSVSPEIVHVILGETWLDALVPIAIIPMVLPLRLVSSQFFTVLNALGKPNTNLAVLVFSAINVVVSMLIGVQWGVEGACWSLLLCHTVNFLVLVKVSSAYTNFGFGQVAATVWRPLLIASAMYSIIYFLRPLFPEPFPDAMRMIALIAAGAAVYLALTFQFCRSDLISIVKFILNR